MDFFVRVILPVFVGAVTISFWVVWIRIASVALRTGRLLARGRTYSRVDSPKMYWAGLILMSLVGLLLAFSTVVLAMGPR